MKRKKRNISKPISCGWSFMLYCAAFFLQLLPVLGSAEEASPESLAQSGAKPIELGNKKSVIKPAVTGECKVVDINRAIYYAAKLATRETSEKSIKYLLELYVLCPHFSCALAYAYDNAKADTKSVFSADEIKFAILKYGDICIPKYISYYKDSEIIKIQLIYEPLKAEKAAAEKAAAEKAAAEKAAAEKAAAEKAINDRRRRLATIAVHAKRSKAGWSLFGIGLPLLAGSIVLGIASENRSIVGTRGCTSPSGVQNDPCLYDLRGAYIPGIVVGVGMTATGLVLGILNRGSSDASERQ